MNIKKKFTLYFKGAISNGFLYVVIILILVSLLGFVFIGGKVPQTEPTEIGSEVVVNAPNIEKAKNNLQLYTFKGATITPTPPPPVVNQCLSNPFNEEPDIFYASDPAAGGIAAAGSQIRIWANDGNGGSVALGTVFDSNGVIITPGDRTAHDGRGENYYLWEPALYLTPLTSPDQPGPFTGDVENGGTPHFPIIVKGEVSEADQGNKKGFVKVLPPIDPPVNVVGGGSGHGGHIGEYIWDVDSLGLAPGLYRVQEVIHDGDGDLAVNCTTIQL